MLMQTKPQIDFHEVEEKHRGIDARLRNWARWCNGTSAPATSPMFRLYMGTARGRSDSSSLGISVDRGDAVKIAKGVAALPSSHRAALNWSYIKPVSPKRACQAIGVSLEGLKLLVRDGRQMLLNKNT